MKNTFYCIVIFLFSFPSYLLAADTSEQEKIYKNLETFSNVLTLLQQHYVDDIEAQEVISGAINGMLTSLDPHSSYMHADDFKELQEETKGSFSGIGIEITIRDSILTVVSPIEGTPAYNEGLQANDQIVAIDGEPSKNMTLMQAVKKLRGKKGTEVTITIHRKSWQELKDISLVRDVIPLHSVKVMELEPGFLTVRITNFQSKTVNDLQKALNVAMEKEALKGIIIDLRNNPGGLLDQAIKVVDLFLDEGIIVSTRGRRSEQNTIFNANKSENNYTFPIIVMVNEGSASASEIVAGALQDHRRAIILGTVTFGKGSVQTIIPMPEGAGIRLTTARYYTPSGDSIQATGIKPDITVEFVPPKSEEKNKDTNHSFREKDLPNHFENDDSTEKKTKKQPENIDTKETEENKATTRLRQDNQLRTALIILKSLELTAREKDIISN